MTFWVTFALLSRSKKAIIEFRPMRLMRQVQKCGETDRGALLSRRSRNSLRRQCVETSLPPRGFGTRV